MFKTMRILLGILALLMIGFTSCEGRKTKNQALAEAVEEFKKNVSFEIEVYHPESYVEQDVDTLFSNGFHVNIKTYADLENSVLYTKIKDTINYQTHYRNFNFDILIEKDGKSIFKKHFNKQIINTLFNFNSKTTSHKSDDDFELLGILKSVELVNDLPISNTIKIDVLYTIPETHKRSLHTIFIDENGSYKVKRNETI